MGIASRINRLERYHRTTQCPVCRGQPPWVVSHVNEHEPVPEVQGCKGCGEVDHLVIRYVNESLPNGPKVETPMLPGNKLAELYS
jgi:hypothetical protein